MAQYTAEAFVLGVHNWGDADKMVTLFTKERGRVKCAVFGCRRPKSPLAAAVQMFNRLEVQLTEGARLATMKQASLCQRYRRLTEDLEVMAYGSFVAELVREFLPEGEADIAVYELLEDVFAAFEVRNPRVTALTAAWQILEYTGMQLRFERCVHCGTEIAGDAFFQMKEGGVLCTNCGREAGMPFSDGLRRFLLNIRAMDWKEPPQFKVHREELLQAEALLLDYLPYMMGKPLKSLTFIQQLS